MNLSANALGFACPMEFSSTTQFSALFFRFANSSPPFSQAHQRLKDVIQLLVRKA